MRHRRRALLLGSVLAAIVVVAGAPSFTGAASAAKPATKHTGSCTLRGATTTPDAASTGTISMDMEGSGKGLTCRGFLQGTWKADSSVNHFSKKIKPTLGTLGNFQDSIQTPVFTGILAGELTPTVSGGTPVFIVNVPPAPAWCVWYWHFFPNVGPSGQWGWQLVCVRQLNLITWSTN